MRVGGELVEEGVWVDEVWADAGEGLREEREEGGVWGGGEGGECLRGGEECAGERVVEGGDRDEHEGL